MVEKNLLRMTAMKKRIVKKTLKDHTSDNGLGYEGKYKYELQKEIDEGRP